MEIALENLYDSSWLVGARKKYARRIIGLKLLHIRRCGSETRYSAIFKTCFPPHNAEPSTSVLGEEEVRIRLVSYRAIERATRSRNFTARLRASPCIRAGRLSATRNSRPSLFSNRRMKSLFELRRCFQRFSSSILTILPRVFRCYVINTGVRGIDLEEYI